MGLSETMVLELIQGLVDRGVMRKLAAVVRHREVGYVKNVLVVWSVPVERVEMVGALFAAQKYVTHCYERTPLIWVVTTCSPWSITHPGVVQMWWNRSLDYRR